MQSNHSEKQVVKETSDFLQTIAESVLPGNTLLVTSQSFTSRGVTAQIVNCLAEPVYVLDQITSHPQLDFISQCYERYKGLDIVNVISLGGGSVVDVGKVLAGLLPASAPAFAEVVEQKLPLKDFPGRCITIPTTAGTGAEVTAFATLWDSLSGRKYSISCTIPHVVIFEPELCLSLPHQITLYSALDAISHAVESLWNVNRNSQSEGLAVQALEELISALPKVLQNPQNNDARRQLQWAAYRAGAAINITKTAVAHAISYPFTLQCAVPHGLACSFTLKAIIEDVGSAQLKIPASIADKLLKVLEDVSLEQEMSKFVGCREIAFTDAFYLDPSRAGNFLFSIDTEWAKKIVMASL